MRHLLREWRFWLFAFALLLSIASIGYAPWKTGVVVAHVDADSPLAPYVTPGEGLQAINEQPIYAPADLEKWENYTGVMRVVHGGRISLVNVEGGGLGVEVAPVGTSNLALGMDLIGGTRVLLEPQYPEDATAEDRDAIAEQTITTLETRTNIYGLREIPIRPVKDIGGLTYIQVETTEGTLSDIETVLNRQGKFEAFVPREVEWFDDSGVLGIGGENYTIAFKDNASIAFEGKTYGANQTFEAGGLTFEVRNVTNESAQLAVRVFTGDDIKYVHTDASNAYVVKRGNFYEFSFGIIVSDSGAQRFAGVTADLAEITDLQRPDDCVLEKPIELYLDRELVSSLRITCGLRGDVVNSVSITGGRETEEAALQEMKQLQTVLKSGALPVPLKPVRTDTVSPTLGKQFLASVSTAGVLAFIGVVAIVYLRYRRIDIALPMLLIALSEIIMILGLAAAIKWTIDLAAIAGIIASIGTGVNDQIVIADEALRKEHFTAKERVKRAFFIVFGAAATIIAAMIPLGFIGIGVMRGFAVTTIFGVLIGILITRPFYGKLVERMVKE
ncbi:MAG: hypothetical protein HYS81_02160 [Candidatus Aenigmatarchaeota archaeon]|nr:MAG: hypothetical protein HYS81_02160 [Candidatus Aenigmarchaeota archaeon]